MRIEPRFKQEFSNTILDIESLLRFEPRIKGDINDNSLGKLLVRIKPRFNQQIKN